MSKGEKKELLREAIIKLLSGIIMLGVLLFLSMPLILGSLLSFIIMLAYIPIIVKRIRNEEQVLESELKGYMEYKRKVKYRLIPFIW